MKKVLLLVAAAGLLVATPSCKKGENDPGMSLKSRKSRLAGEYTIASSTSKLTGTDTDGDITLTEVKVDGSTGTEVVTYTEVGESPYVTTKTITVNKGEYSFTKDGTWEREWNTTTTWTEDGWGGIVENTKISVVSTLKETGTWSFLGGEPEAFKKKERISLDVLTLDGTDQTTRTDNLVGGTTVVTEGDLERTEATAAHGDNVEIIEIDMLKGSEITFIMDLGSSYKFNDGDGTISGTTYVGDAKMELVEK